MPPMASHKQVPRRSLAWSPIACTSRAFPFGPRVIFTFTRRTLSFLRSHSAKQARIATSLRMTLSMAPKGALSAPVPDDLGLDVGTASCALRTAFFASLAGLFPTESV